MGVGRWGAKAGRGGNRIVPPLAPLRARSPSPSAAISRPRNIDEVAHQEEVVKTLRRALETNNVSGEGWGRRRRRARWRSNPARPVPSLQLPHLLFYGPPGTGKTSTALAIARQLYG